MEQHIYVARQISPLETALEGTLVFWVKWEKRIASGGDLSYTLTHEVSPGRTWECGELTLARLRELPDVLRPVINEPNSRAGALDYWTDIEIRIPDAVSKDELDHLRLVMNEFTSNLPPGTMMRSTGDQVVVLETPSIPRAHESRVGLPRSAVVDLGQALSAPAPAKRGLDAAEVERRAAIVRRAREIREASGRLWADIAKELGVPERTLRDWRHNPRFG